MGEVRGRHKRWPLKCGSQGDSTGSEAQLERRWWQGLALWRGRGQGLRAVLPQPFLPGWEERLPSHVLPSSPHLFSRAFPPHSLSAPSPPMGPTCEEHLVLEKALNHPQQPVLHILAASLLTLLFPRDGEDKIPSGTLAFRNWAPESHLHCPSHTSSWPI